MNPEASDDHLRVQRVRSCSSRLETTHNQVRLWYPRLAPIHEEQLMKIRDPNNDMNFIDDPVTDVAARALVIAFHLFVLYVCFIAIF